uniref:Uncharacterized protein n=1 Tax=Rhizophora mucronata TaxID=61149 RepID=A0A2P2P425_RHIMU
MVYVEASPGGLAGFTTVQGLSLCIQENCEGAYQKLYRASSSSPSHVPQQKRQRQKQVRPVQNPQESRRTMRLTEDRKIGWAVKTL